MKPHRRQPLFLAFLLHRLSGLGLAIFLPFHFYALALALTDPARLDEFLQWSESPLVKISETGRVQKPYVRRVPSFVELFSYSWATFMKRL